MPPVYRAAQMQTWSNKCATYNVACHTNDRSGVKVQICCRTCCLEKQSNTQPGKNVKGYVSRLYRHLLWQYCWAVRCLGCCTAHAAASTQTDALSLKQTACCPAKTVKKCAATNMQAIKSTTCSRTRPCTILSPEAISFATLTSSPTSLKHKQDSLNIWSSHNASCFIHNMSPTAPAHTSLSPQPISFATLISSPTS